MVAVVATLFGAVMLGILFLVGLCCATAIVIFCTLHLQRVDERELLWQRLSAHQALHDLQQREREQGRGPDPIEPDLSPSEKVELASLNQWAMSRNARPRQKR